MTPEPQILLQVVWPHQCFGVPIDLGDTLGPDTPTMEFHTNDKNLSAWLVWLSG